MSSEGVTEIQERLKRAFGIGPEDAIDGKLCETRFLCSDDVLKSSVSVVDQVLSKSGMDGSLACSVTTGISDDGRFEVTIETTPHVLTLSMAEVSEG